MGTLPGPYASFTLAEVILRSHPLNGADPKRVGDFWYELAKGADTLGIAAAPRERWEWTSAALTRRGYDAPAVDAVLTHLLHAPEMAPKDAAQIQIPAVPDGTYPDADGSTVATWLDDYITYASGIAPMTPRLFHESAALWLISTVIARRLVLPMSWGPVYPNLFIAWIADTTVFHKTTALSIAEQWIRSYFPHLMTPQDVTYEALLGDLAGMAPANFEKLPDQTQQRWKDGRQFAAQRGWCLDEMSGLLASAGKDYNAGLVEALLRLYDCAAIYQRNTIGRGLVEIQNAYMSFLGASTPAGLSAHLTATALWDNGWWPRFALLTPEDDPIYQEGSWSAPPSDLVRSLQRLAQSLPPSTYPTGGLPIPVSLGPGVGPAANRTGRIIGHSMILDSIEDKRFYGLYGRLPTQTLKVAQNLAAIDWARGDEQIPVLTMGHYSRACQITERWRQSAHRALATVQMAGHNQVQQAILRTVERCEPYGISARDIGRNMRHIESKTVAEALKALTTIGEIYEFEPQMPKGGRPTKKFRMVPE